MWPWWHFYWDLHHQKSLLTVSNCWQPTRLHLFWAFWHWFAHFGGFLTLVGRCRCISSPGHWWLTQACMWQFPGGVSDRTHNCVTVLTHNSIGRNPVQQQDQILKLRNAPIISLHTCICMSVFVSHSHTNAPTHEVVCVRWFHSWSVALPEGGR